MKESVRDMNLKNGVLTVVRIPFILVILVIVCPMTTILTGCVVNVHIVNGKNIVPKLLILKTKNKNNFRNTTIVTNNQLTRKITNIDTLKIMKKTKIVSWHNYSPSKPEYNTGEIVTVPDQAFSVEEILEKFTRGIDVGDLYRSGRYSNTDDLDELDYSREVNDPYDIDEEIIDEVPKFKRKRGEKLPTGLPEDGGDQNSPKDEGVKEGKKEP